MKHLKLFLAFAFGFVVAAALGLANNSVKAGNPDAVRTLESRLRDLEEAASRGRLPSTVNAPFEVVDPATRKSIFYVNDGRVELHNKEGLNVAYIDTQQGGGQFVTTSSKFNLITSFGAFGQSAGMTIYEGGKLKVDLGRNPEKGTYRLLFNKDEKSYLAGIGQSGIGTGLAFISDSTGNVRASVRTTDSGRGLFVVYGQGNNSLAELTEGEGGGGRMALFNNKGDNMVVAGVTEGGFGVVRAGPGSFMPGYGTLGLPGSFIMGKK